MHQSIQLYPQVNFVIGQNGHGKTNFIEAIYCLSRGKSFRTSKLKELVSQDISEASVFAKVVRENTSSTIGMSIKNGERQFYLDQDPVKSIRDILGKIICVTFTPNDLALVKGGPSERRSFIDKHILDTKPAYIELILNYQRALKNKNILLKKGISQARDLSPWNKIMADTGYAIYKEREIFLQQLEPKVDKYYRRFSNEATEVKLTFKEPGSQSDSYDSSNALLEKLESVAARELNLHSTVMGPHRQDLQMSINTNNARSFASQGEARSLVLALKLAALEIIEEKTFETPITLLDDVDSELDSHRREALMEMIFSKVRQVIVTATHIRQNELERYGKYAVFEVANGQIREKNPEINA